MFSRLSAWLWPARKESVTAPTLDVWKPSERLIFTYFRGKGLEEVSADPMPIYRKVKDIQQEVNADLILARSKMKGNLKGYELAAKRIRGAFNLIPFEEGGLTELECIDLYNAFWAFVGVEKKNTPNSTTTSEATSTPTPTSSNGDSPETSSTPSGSDGGSTVEGDSTPQPPPSPLASVSP